MWQVDSLGINSEFTVKAMSFQQFSSGESEMGEAGLAGDARWLLAKRVADSPDFEKAAQLRDILLYLAQGALIAPPKAVTEQEIGVKVLGRRPDYDPQADNIVRVQIRHLRQKLERYFLTEGLHEPVVIVIPKGNHILRFEPRLVQSPAAPPVPVPAPSGRLWLTRLAAAAVLAAAAFLAGRFSLPSAAVTDNGSASASPLWTLVFRKGQPTTIVVADSSAVILQNVLRKDFTLTEYVDRSYRELIESVSEPGLRDALRMIASRQYTSLADAIVSGDLRLLGARIGARASVRYARDLHIRDFNTGDFILIGSSHGIPWVELFEASMNFHFEYLEEQQRFGFRNKKPLRGEAAMYAMINSSGTGPQESFATISLLPNLARNGAVVILAGVSMEATEAAGKFAMADEFSRELARVLGTRGQKLPYFEVLLKTVSMAGAPRKTEIVAWRKPAV
jgi:hypothetical protein